MGCGSSAPSSTSRNVPTSGGSRRVRAGDGDVAAAGAGGPGAGGGMDGPLLRAPAAWKHEAGPITRFNLRCMREEFWEKTKVAGGRPQTANIRPNDASLGCCFDVRRHRYEIPRYCYSNPTNIRDGVVQNLVDSGAKTEEAQESKPLPIAVRVSFTEMLIKLDMTTTTTIHDVKQAVHEYLVAKAEEADPDTTVDDDLPAERQRMFFGGRELNDALTLAACGLKKGYVVQVTGRPTAEKAAEFCAKYGLSSS